LCTRCVGQKCEGEGGGEKGGGGGPLLLLALLCTLDEWSLGGTEERSWALLSIPGKYQVFEATMLHVEIYYYYCDYYYYY